MATSLAAASLLFTIFFCTLSSLTNQSPVSNTTSAFSVGLIHRDSPLSPLYNPNATLSDRRIAALDRSKRRHAFILSTLTTKKPTREALNVTVIETGSEYLMNISIGFPPYPILVFMDTGSSLLWVQCLPCIECFPHFYPIYDPRKSYSFAEVVCPSDECDYTDHSWCTRDYSCAYGISYADGSRSEGVIAKDWLSFVGVDGNRTTFWNVLFGCGRTNVGIYDRQSSGIAGIGLGPLSLISQLGDRGLPMTFSHCFLPPWRSKGVSNMIIGQNKSSVLPDSAPWTALIVEKINGISFYVSDLDGISVAGERLAIEDEAFGDTVVDTGSTLTYLTSIAFYALWERLEDLITLPKETEKGQDGGLCYRGTLEDMTDGKKMPIVTLHFHGGLDVPLHPTKTFWEWTPGVWCLAMDHGQLTVVGNVAMNDMYVRYDFEALKFYMSPTDCHLVDDH